MRTFDWIVSSPKLFEAQTYRAIHDEEEDDVEALLRETSKKMERDNG